MMGRDRHELERRGLKNSKREDTEPYLMKSEPATMMSIKTNTRGSTQMNAPEIFTDKSGTELVAMFNKMAESDLGKELGAKTVTRFADTKAGIARCEKLASSIKARKEGLKTATATTQPINTEETTEMAAKKAAKKSTKKAADKPATNQTKIAVEFGARSGSFREKLLNHFHDNYRKMVPVNGLLKATYGSMNTENKGALAMVIKGAEATIKKSKLGYQIKKEKNAETKEISFGLYPK